MGPEEYLRTSFDGADCEYVDGEVVERNAGELPHSLVLGNLTFLLAGVAEPLGLQVLPVIRIRIRPDRYRVADVGVWRAGPIGDRIPTVPPFLVVEILSPEDSMVRMVPKLQDYFSIGAEWIWLIDPREPNAVCFSKAHPGGVLCDVLRTENPAIEIPLSAVLEGLPSTR